MRSVSVVFATSVVEARSSGEAVVRAMGADVGRVSLASEVSNRSSADRPARFCKNIEALFCNTQLLIYFFVFVDYKKGFKKCKTESEAKE